MNTVVLQYLDAIPLHPGPLPLPPAPPLTSSPSAKPAARQKGKKVTFKEEQAAESSHPRSYKD